MSSAPWLNPPTDRNAVLEAFLAYIENEDIPIIAEFCYQQKITRTMLYKWPEAEGPLEMCRMKKEAALEAGTLMGRLNPAMAIFSLKQLGWRDRQELEHSGTVKNSDEIDYSKYSAEELATMRSLIAKGQAPGNPNA